MRTFRLLARRPGALLGMFGAVVLLALAGGADAFEPLLAGHLRDSDALPPSDSHWLGTDLFRNDVLAVLAYGARASLTVGVGAVVLVLSMGVTFGALAGFFGGRFDRFLTRAVEVLLSFPTIFVALAMRGITGRSEALALAIVIGLLRWTDIARVTRAEVLKSTKSDYVTAARALGVSPLRILWRHILPEALAPAVTAAPFAMASAILVESTLSFLGVGLAPGSWGALLAQARLYPPGWWLSFFPGLLLFVAVASFHAIGEALRDVNDPRLRGAL